MSLRKRSKILRDRAHEILDSGIIEDERWFHVTTEDNLFSVLSGGLAPNAAQANFKGYAEHSAGRVFVVGGLDSAKQWARIMRSRGLDPVILEVTRDLYDDVFYDEEGSREIEGSFFVKKSIPVSQLRRLKAL